MTCSMKTNCQATSWDFIRFWAPNYAWRALENTEICFWLHSKAWNGQDKYCSNLHKQSDSYRGNSPLPFILSEEVSIDYEMYLTIRCSRNWPFLFLFLAFISIFKLVCNLWCYLSIPILCCMEEVFHRHTLM